MIRIIQDTARHPEYQFLDLLNLVLRESNHVGNRTDVGTIKVPHYMMQFDLAKGFPAVTTKKLFWKAVVGELIGFLEGTSSVSRFEELDCFIWRQNAEETPLWLESEHRKGNDDLGRIYGVQARKWGSNISAEGVDQFARIYEQLKTNPLDRRMLVSHWNPADIANNEMALPPCHVLYKFQYTPHDNKLHLDYYQRSCDLFLGVPFNVASYALLLSMTAKSLGMNVGSMAPFMSDCHIYTNAIEQSRLQVTRQPLPMPTLEVPIEEGEDLVALIDSGELGKRRNGFKLNNYTHHAPIKADMVS